MPLLSLSTPLSLLLLVLLRRGWEMGGVSLM
jgi:hypothetical protein